MKIDFEFKDEQLVLNFFVYNGGRVGILMLYKDGNLWGPATLNISDIRCKQDEVIIKDYDQNVGLYERLKEMKIVEVKRRDLMVGVKRARICKLTDIVLEKLKQSKNDRT